MTLAVVGYPTKKALIAAKGKRLNYTETSPLAVEYKPTGKFCVVGPDPRTRKWFAEVTMKDNLIEKVT